MWWRDAVIYNIYPRSFADSDGDGVGDLAGITARLDHLAWLGVDGIWVCPIGVSPDTDWGYDVSDYCDIQPVFGDLADLDRLVAEAGARGIRVLLDLVPNHTSDQHPWFVEARSGRDAPPRGFYVWADGKQGGSPPNNWRSSFGGPAWTFDPPSGQWYLHNFLPTQPDLDWWNDDVRAAFDEIMRFWFDRGVAGFRIDVCQKIVKDAELRDNPPAEPGDHPYVVNHGQRKLYNTEQPESHAVFRRWRALADSYDPPRLLLGETYVLDVASLATYYGNDDELHLGGNFVFLHSPFRAEALRAVVEDTERHFAPSAWPLWAVSTHDLPRFPTRWCAERPEAVRAVLLMLLTLRGTPILYYGDELGLPDTPLGAGQRRDPVGTGAFDAGPGRDPSRTPMPWARGPGAGFTDPGAEPWLPIDLCPGMTVEEQRADPGSTLHLCRDLIDLRRRSDDLRSGSYASLPSPDGVWMYRRGEGVAVALNLTDDAVEVEVPIRLRASSRIVVGTRRERCGERLDAGRLALGGFEAALIDTTGQTERP